MIDNLTDPLQSDLVVQPRVTQTMIVPGSVYNKHLQQGLAAIKFGQSDERPESGEVYPAWFSLDTNVLSIWNGTAWKSVTLT